MDDKTRFEDESPFAMIDKGRVKTFDKQTVKKIDSRFTKSLLEIKRETRSHQSKAVQASAGVFLTF